MSRVCVSILVHDAAKARRDIAEAVEAGAEMIELRVDPLATAGGDDGAQTVEGLIRACGVPCIVTCRASSEGGECDRPDAERLALLRRATAGRGEGDITTYVDLEFATVKALPNRAHGLNPRRLILSAHDFTGRPARLYNLLEEMTDIPAAANKVAWTPRSIRDCQEAFELLRVGTRPTIAICMGPHGAITRILARKFGAFLTFAAVREDARTAPGQPTIEELKRVYRWDAQNAQTRVYGVVGSPIAHSMSPAVHNAAFEAAGLNAVYVPLLVNEGYESFKAFMETFVVAPEGPLRLDGLSVTIPHKENAYRYLREAQEHGVAGRHIETDAGFVKAVNTISVAHDPTGRACELFGHNTDYDAILDTITAALEIRRVDLERLRVAVIGAGGVGRTAVAALAAMGARVVVFNRSPQRAEALVEEFGGRHGHVVARPLDALPGAECDVYVNATSLGMSPNVNDSPFAGGMPKLGSNTLVFDTVYNPATTRLLSEATAAGARTVGGVEMFLRQAAAQFEGWTGRPPQKDVMRRALASRLRA